MTTKVKPRAAVVAGSNSDALIKLQRLFNRISTEDGWSDSDIARLAGCCPQTCTNFRTPMTRFPRWQTVVALFDVVGYQVTVSE